MGTDERWINSFGVCEGKKREAGRTDKKPGGKLRTKKQTGTC